METTKNNSNITLAGFMGTGKTTIGKIISERTGHQFVDMDEIISQRQNRSVSEIFEKSGEQYFRQLEHNLVIELSRQDRLVIATGGGIVLNPGNIAVLSSSGTLVCLKTRPDIILKRLEKDTTRPLLEHPDKMERICAIIDKRKHLYDSIPFSIDTSDLTPEQAACLIINHHEQQAL